MDKTCDDYMTTAPFQIVTADEHEFILGDDGDSTDPLGSTEPEESSVVESALLLSAGVTDDKKTIGGLMKLEDSENRDGIIKLQTFIKQEELFWADDDALESELDNYSQADCDLSADIITSIKQEIKSESEHILEDLVKLPSNPLNDHHANIKQENVCKKETNPEVVKPTSSNHRPKGEAGEDDAEINSDDDNRDDCPSPSLAGDYSGDTAQEVHISEAMDVSESTGLIEPDDISSDEDEKPTNKKSSEENALRKYTCADFIALALLSEPSNSAPTKKILKYISENFPEFCNKEKNWNIFFLEYLNRSKYFVQVGELGRSPNTSWTFQPGFEKKLLTRLKIKHNFNVTATANMSSSNKSQAGEPLPTSTAEGQPRNPNEPKPAKTPNQIQDAKKRLSTESVPPNNSEVQPGSSNWTRQNAQKRRKVLRSSSNNKQHTIGTTVTDRSKGIGVDRFSNHHKVKNSCSLSNKTNDEDKKVNIASVTSPISSESELTECLMLDKNKNSTNLIIRKSYESVRRNKSNSGKSIKKSNCDLLNKGKLPHKNKSSVNIGNKDIDQYGIEGRMKRKSKQADSLICLPGGGHTSQSNKVNDTLLINENTVLDNDKLLELTVVDSNEEAFENAISIKSDRMTFEKTLCKELQEQITQQDEPNHSCPQCEEKFVSRIDLLSHVEVHLDLERLICLFCGLHMNNKKVLKKHFITTHSEKKKETCQICQRDFVSLWYHNRVYHDPQFMSSEPIQCDFCPKTFMNTFLFSSHVTIHSNKKFTCADCNSTFRRKEKLKKHIFRWHLPPQISCTECPEMFYSKESLNHHLWTEHSINKKKIYICDICGKALTNIVSYRGHLAGHSDEKPFMCTECGKKFRTSANLTQHAHTHSDLRPFSCDLCDKSFRIRNHLRQHMAVHNMVSTSTSRRRKRGNTRNEGDGTSATDYE